MVTVTGAVKVGTASFAPTATVTLPVAPTAMPGASNTGVPVGTVLTKSGPITAATPGQIIDGKDITGTVTIKAPGVVIRNCKIHGSGSGDGVKVQSGDVTIYDTEIYGFENAIGYTAWAAYRINVHDNTGDGVKLGSNCTLQDSWIHNLTPGSGAHADGGQVQEGVTNLVVRHNTIDVSSSGSTNSALFISPDLGPSTSGPVLIEDNYLDGGGFTIFVVDGNNGQFFVQNITVRNNTFGRKASYGPVRNNVPVTWTGNKYADNGAAIPLP